MDKISYRFDDNGVQAVKDNTVIASAASLDELVEHLAADEPEPCPNCGKEGGCDHEHEEDDDNMPEKMATHIVTPNGLKGKIMGRASGVWGDQVTVRFENGHIAQLHVAEVKLTHETEKTSSEPSVIDEINHVLTSSYDSDPYSLRIREADLKDTIDYIQKHTAKTSDAELAELDNLKVSATYELNEIRDTLRYIADNQEFENHPFSINVMEQETMGKHASSWLDDVAQNMIKEAESIDYEKLMNEGPSVFVAGLETGSLGDTGTVRVMASNYIRTKTAAAKPEIRDAYESKWLEQIENARREELSSRKETMSKQASVTPEPEGEDESIFL